MNDEGRPFMQSSNLETRGGKSSSTASSVSPEQDSLEKKRRDIEWNIRYNSAVCDEYSGFYSFCDKVCTFIVALFGTYTFMTFFIGMNRVYAVVSLVVSVITVSSLVFRFSEKSVSESNRRFLYDGLLAKVKVAKKISQLEDIERRLVEVSVGEPKRLEIVRAVAYNEAAGQMGCDEKYNVDVGWFKRLTRFVIPWERPSYKVLQEVDEN